MYWISRVDIRLVLQLGEERSDHYTVSKKHTSNGGLTDSNKNSYTEHLPRHGSNEMRFSFLFRFNSDIQLNFIEIAEE